MDHAGRCRLIARLGRASIRGGLGGKMRAALFRPA